MITYNTKLIQIPHPQDADLVRKAVVANALSVKDLTGSDPKLAKIFVDLLGPVAGTWDLKKISTCALVSRGLWRRVGVDMPALYSNYVFGTAISAEIKFAQSLKPYSAWNVPTPGLFPDKGSYVVIGEGLSTHVLNLIDFDGETVISIDGGQVDETTGYQCIKERQRKWIVKNGVPYIDTRKVIGWISVDMLPYRMGQQITVPEGWEDVEL